MQLDELRQGARQRGWEVVGEYVDHGSEQTHWRSGTSGKTRSTKCTAVSVMRRPRHEGQ